MGDENISEKRAKGDVSPHSSISITSESEIEYMENANTTVTPKKPKSSFEKQLETTLGPKMYLIEETDGPTSRYGRHRKTKILMDGFIPTDVARFVTKSGSKMSKTITEKELSGLKTPTKITRIDPDTINWETATPEKTRIESKRTTNAVESAEIKFEKPKSPIKVSRQSLDELVSEADSGRGSSIDFAIELDVKVGTLYWAQYKTGFYWPCLIAPDPFGNLIDNKLMKNKHIVNVHVYYFADQGRRAWVPCDKLLPYKGFDDLKISQKVHKTCTKPKNFKKSREAADKYLQMPLVDRYEYFQKEVELEKAEKGLRPQITSSKRESLETNDDMSERSSSPESPAYEDITMEDRASVQEEFERLKPTIQALAEKNRKNRLSLNNSISKASPGARYSKRTIELLKKQALKSSTPSPSPVAAPKRVAKPKTIQERPLQQMLTEDFITQNLGTWCLYPVNSLKQEYVCRLCLYPKNLKKCISGCHGYYHEDCVSKERSGEPIPARMRKIIGSKSKGDSKHNGYLGTFSNESETNKPISRGATPIPSSIEEFSCYKCETKSNEICFVCSKSENLIKCSYQSCGHFYHTSCLDKFPQADTQRSFICPHHKCHSCFSMDISDNIVPDNKLVTCVLCPTAYHYNDITCIPAGVEFLTASQIICPNHALRPSAKVNADDCGKCGGQGKLFCCEQCPAAVHFECLNMTEIPDHFICDDCKFGRKPLYNEVVWVKLGIYRWWPALILPPEVVPINMLEKQHFPNDFCVKFLGSHDVSWLSRDRVYIFQDGDELTKKKAGTSRLDIAYAKSLYEAGVLLKMVTEQKEKLQESRFSKVKPTNYQKIFVNKAVPPARLDKEEEFETDDTHCNCKETDDDPCGPWSGCINRSLVQECQRTCPAKDKCNNQCFTKRIYPKMKVIRSRGKGWGLFAMEDIKEGQFVIEYVGEVIAAKEKNRRLEKKFANKDDHFYIMHLSDSRWIDAEHKGNNARFMNHCCNPNCETQIWHSGKTSRIGIFAFRDIKEGEELTFDYMFETLGEQQMPCLCGAPNCRKFIGRKKRSNDSRESTPSSSRGSSVSNKRKKPTKTSTKNAKKRKLDVPSDEGEIEVEQVTVDIEGLEIPSDKFVPESDITENSVMLS